MSTINQSAETKNKYDVISVSHYFYPRVGGLEKMAYELLKNLQKNSLRVISLHGGEDSYDSQVDGIDVKVTKVLAIFNGTYPIFGIRFFLKLLQTLRQNPKALVIIHDRHLTSSFVAMLACILSGRSYIVISHTTISNYFKFKLFEFIGEVLDRTLFKMVLLFANKIIAVSETNKGYLTQMLNVNPEKILVIYNGFNTNNVSKYFTQEPKEKEIIFATKWIPVKDPATTLEAFALVASKHPEWTFKFVGQGDEVIPAKYSLPNNVVVINHFYTQDELFMALQKSAIYVNSSLNEGLSVGVIEAAAMNNIPLLSDAPSNLEVARKLGTLKFTFTRRDVNALALKLDAAITALEENDMNVAAALEVDLTKMASAHFSDRKVFTDYYIYLKNYALKQHGLNYPITQEGLRTRLDKHDYYLLNK